VTKEKNSSDLIIAIDLSENGARVIALVGARECTLKTRRFARATAWIKHFRELGSDKKRQYLTTFPRRFRKVREYLELVKICMDIDCVQRYVDQYKPYVVMIDNKLYNEIKHPRKVRESDIKEHHRKKLITIADNLANYFRALQKKNPKRLHSNLREFEK